MNQKKIAMIFLGATVFASPALHSWGKEAPTPPPVVDPDLIRGARCKDGIELPPHVPCGNVNAHLDFLYWRAYEDGLEYGTKISAGPLIGVASVASTKMLDLEFEWNPGFSLGLGYLTRKPDHWGINLDWTHIRNKAHRSKSAKGTESQVEETNNIISPWVNLLFELRFGASHASAHWRLDYNTFDLDFARSVAISNKFILNPFFGFRAAMIHQNYRAKYNTVFIVAEHAIPFTRQVLFKAKNQFNGFGLRTGTELMWRFNRHWHLFSDLAGALLYGKFNVKMKNLNDQGLGEGSIPPSPLDFKASEILWRVRLNFEESIGLGWEHFYRNDRTRLTARLAYALSQWPHQNELYYTFYFRGQDTISLVPIRNGGDLSFQGAQASLRLDF